MSELKFDPIAPVITCIYSDPSRTLEREAIRQTYFAGLPSPFFFMGGSPGKPRWTGDTLTMNGAGSRTDAAVSEISDLFSCLLDQSAFQYIVILRDSALARLSVLYTFLFSLYSGAERPDYLVARSIQMRTEGGTQTVYDADAGVVLSRCAVEKAAREAQAKSPPSGPARFEAELASALARLGVAPDEIGDVLAIPAKPLSMLGLHYLHNGIAGVTAPENKWLSAGNSLPPTPPAKRGEVLFYCCHQLRFLYLSIPKCACTSMKALILRHDGLNPSEDQEAIHAQLGYAHAPPHAYDARRVDDLAGLSEYLRFAVYRDPVERFVSLYVNKVVQQMGTQDIFTSHFGKSMDAFLDTAEELFASYAMPSIDHHLRPQAYWLNATQLDWIVPLEELRKFMRKHFSVSLPQRNTSKSALERISPLQRSRIMRLYAEDYEINPQWKI
jgi:hypothetical protein